MVPLLGSRYSEYGNIGSFSLDVSSFDTIPLLVLLLMNMKRIPERNLNQYRLLLAIFALSSIMSIYSSMILLGRLIYYANSAFFVASGMMAELGTQYSEVAVLWNHSCIWIRICVLDAI